MRYKYLVILAVVAMSILSSCVEQSVMSSSNPLLESWEESPFGIPPFERIRPDHYLEAFDVAIAEQQTNIDYIVSDSTEVSFHSVIVGLDQSGNRLQDLSDLFEMCEMAISDDDWVRVGELVKPKISEAEDAVWMNDALFGRVKSLYEVRDTLGLEQIDARLLERTYQRFVRGGAELDAEQKSRLMQINSRLAVLSSRFSSNLIADSDQFYLTLTSKDLEGMNGDMKRLAKSEAERRGLKDRWAITLNPSSMTPFLTYSQRRDLREQLYKAYVKRGANGNEFDNRAIVVEMTELRQERARMLGYANHAEYVISQQMAGSADAAYELLNSAWGPALEIAKRERELLQERLSLDEEGAKLEPWDWRYYAERIRSMKADLNDEMMRPYFLVDGVRVGAFTLANRLYGITFRPVAVPLYDISCTAYEVLDRDGSHLGVLYFDLYARPNKSYGAWCGNLREQRTDGGDRITPVVAITCNFPSPSDNAQTLLTVEQVETLFHEFGHALHFIFQNVDYRSMGAERVEGDFVEFPSQVMENWVLEPEMLRLYALHFRTGQVIPETLVKRIALMRALNQGFETISYLSAALLDLELQRVTDFENFDLESFEHRVLRDERGLIPEIDPKYHLSYFAHPFVYDYSAGYYFYMWSEVLDKDCFELFKRSGDIFSTQLASKLRREVLQRGSEASGRDLYRAFKGGDPERGYMLKSKGLIDEVEQSDEDEVSDDVVPIEQSEEVEMDGAVELVDEAEAEVVIELAEAESEAEAVDGKERSRFMDRSKRDRLIGKVKNDEK